MIALIFFILIYVLSLVTVIKAAITGRGLFLPDFKRIDEIYFLGMKSVWNTWWGILGYYLQLIFHLVTIAIFLGAILLGIYAFLQPR